MMRHQDEHESSKRPSDERDPARELQRKRTLRRLVLTFFSTPEMSRNMHRKPHFTDSGFSNKAIRDMMYACEKAGLLYRGTGTGPGSVYGLTTDGLLLMRTLDAYLEHEANNTQNTQGDI